MMIARRGANWCVAHTSPERSLAATDMPMNVKRQGSLSSQVQRAAECEQATGPASKPAAAEVSTFSTESDMQSLGFRVYTKP